MKDLEKRNSVFHFICSPHEMEQCFLAFYYLLYGSAVLIYPTVPVSVGKATWAPRWLNQEKLGGGAEELSTPPCWRSTEKPVDFNNKSWRTSQCLTGAASNAVKKMKAECACTKKVSAGIAGEQFGCCSVFQPLGYVQEDLCNTARDIWKFLEELCVLLGRTI